MFSFEDNIRAVFQAIRLIQEEKAQVRGAGGRYVSGGGKVGTPAAPKPGGSSGSAGGGRSRGTGGRFAPRDVSKQSFPAAGFKTTAEIEQWAEAHYPHMTFDLHGLDAGLCSRAVRQFDVMAQKYPDVAANIAFFGTGLHKPTKLSNAWTGGKTSLASGESFAVQGFHGGQHAIGLNPKWFNDPKGLEAEYKKCADHGWLAVPTLEGTISHEFGHAVWYHIGDHGGLLHGVEAARADGFGTPNGTLDVWGTAMSHTFHFVSKYAQHGGLIEGWAEGFSAYHHLPASEHTMFVARQGQVLRTFFTSGGKDAWTRPANRYDQMPEFRTLSGPAKDQVRSQLVDLARKIGMPLSWIRENLDANYHKKSGHDGKTLRDFWNPKPVKWKEELGVFDYDKFSDDKPLDPKDDVLD